MNEISNPDSIILDIEISDNKVSANTYIEAELRIAKDELSSIEEQISSADDLRPCGDKIDYALSAGCGMLCGLIDIFLVDVPGKNSTFGNVSDKWIRGCVEKFAKLKGWDSSRLKKSAISFLEDKFKVPYDQRGCGDAGKEIFDLTPTNHHFKSLGHQPSLLGLVFSIIDQFTNQSHFVSNGELIALQDANGKFKLRGNTFISKVFCGFTNWFGHLVSDASGSSSSSGRGMGIPSPIWSWANSIIVLKAKLGLANDKFDKKLCELAVEVYKEGVDFRFTVAQSIPVAINELTIRLFYSIRRYVNICKSGNIEEYSWSEIWKKCKPYKSPTLMRMLTVAHGTFCALDLGDAAIRAFIKGGGSFNTVEFFVRMNIVGVGRFSIALYGEVKANIKQREAEKLSLFAQKEKIIIEDYIRALQDLNNYYNDNIFLNFIESIKETNNLKEIFDLSSEIAEQRNVRNPLKSKKDIDNYFICNYDK